MPEISAFCPACGRSVKHAVEEQLRPRTMGASTQDALLAALAYVTIVPAVLFLAVPQLRGSQFVRFHSWQSIFFGIAAGVAAVAARLLFLVMSVIPFIGFLLAWLSLGLAVMAVVVVWGVVVVKAVLGEAYELPWIGAWAAHLASPGSSADIVPHDSQHGAA